MEECLRKWQANFDTDVGYRKFVISVFLENLIECSHPPVHAFDASNSMQNLFKHLFKMIGMEGCSSHSGRRSLLTNLNNNGINLRTIQKIAGHAHINTTAMYLSVTDTQLHNAVNSVSY